MKKFIVLTIATLCLIACTSRNSKTSVVNNVDSTAVEIVVDSTIVSADSTFVVE